MKSFFTKELAGLKLWWFLIPFIIALVFFLIGTFNDLSISQAIVDQNSGFGIFFEGWGMVVPFIVGAIGSAVLSAGLFQLNHKVWKIIAILFLAFGIIMMTYENQHYIYEYFGGGFWLHEMGTMGIVLAWGMSLLIMAGIGIPCFYLFLKQDPEKLIRIGLVMVLWVILEASIFELTKRMCLRPRYRYLAGFVYNEAGNQIIPSVAYSGVSLDLYRPWYQNWQWFSENKYVATMVDSDSIKSFPSGHTGMCSIVLTVPMLLPLFGLKEDKLKLWQPIAFLLGLVYLFVLGFARIQVGAHWLSDVSGAILFISILVIALLLINDKVKLKKIEK